MIRDIFGYLGVILAIPLFVAGVLGAFRLVIGPPPGPIVQACANAVKVGRMDDNTAKTCLEALKK